MSRDLFGLVAWMLLASAPVTAAPAVHVTRTNQTGLVLTREDQVRYFASNQPPVEARVNQVLNDGDRLRTLDPGRSTVRFDDASSFKLRDRSELVIDVNSLQLRDGELYYSNRGRPGESRSLIAARVRATPRGTEFLVKANGAANQAEFLMFDGEVQVQGDADPTPVLVTNGQHSVTVAGQPTRVVALQANAVVQWWIYYPGVLDPDELALPPAARAELGPSLDAYRSGDLPGALARYPGYPSPPAPASADQRAYLAGLLLGAGSVGKAEALLRDAGTNTPALRALRWMIAAVTRPLPGTDAPAASPFFPGASNSPPETRSEWLALSYVQQSTNNLHLALRSARSAAGPIPSARVRKDRRPASTFGYAWTRVADLEFSLGRIRAAQEAIDVALTSSPSNAQAHSVNGYLLAAQYRYPQAIAAFDRAIALDPALGSAWLGRGLCQLRRDFRWFDLSRRRLTNSWQRDLEAAAMIEPTRALTRAYAGKARSDTHDVRLAEKELAYAKKLDPNDPTPWLYSALELYQQNRPNEAVVELEQSKTLNENRSVYRSRFLLDQDQAVRNSSLAKVYQAAGLDEVALREAARAVTYDYANPSAHQFLAESYDALRDPTRFNLRYETVWFNELMLANVLSPVGAGLLSQNLSQQEYSRLFDRNRVGMSTSTEVRSDGQYREIASHHGLIDRFAYTLDLDYQHNNGTRPNNDLDRIEWYTQLKYQLNDRDSVFLLSKYQSYESGDNFQYYDTRSASRELRFREMQAPIVLGTFHRQWAPGSHSTLLVGRLKSEVAARDSIAVFDVWTNPPPFGTIEDVRLQRFDRSRDAASFTAYVGELNQIWQADRFMTIVGARFQSGAIEVRNVLEGVSEVASNYFPTAYPSAVNASFTRQSVYLYETVEPWETLHLTAGTAFERIEFPENFRSPPLTDERRSRHRLLPKAALQWDARTNLALRGMYAQSLGGLSYDESVRLEPVQLSGIPQAFRSAAAEVETGSALAPRFDVGAVVLDWKVAPRTYVGLDAQWLHSNVKQAVGAFRRDFDDAGAQQATPSSLRQHLDYDERSLGVSIDNLFSPRCTIGAGYRIFAFRLRWAYPEVPASAAQDPNRLEESLVHQLTLRAQYEHPEGLFGRVQARWIWQENDGYGRAPYTDPRHNESVSQVDLFAGWRFPRRRAEISVACLNVTDQDYRLNSLAQIGALSRERVWMARFNFNF